MANNQEIEIKILLDKNTFFSLREKFKKIAKFEKIQHQVDEYFMPPHRNFLAPKYPFEWLSIRKRGNKLILCYKHYYPENVETSTHCDEFEAIIENKDNFNRILSSLNFKKLVTVEKEREIYNYNDEFEIALDTVKELGYFVEIEAIKYFKNIKATREKLFEFADSLKIDISKEDKRGYPFLLMKKKGLIK